MNKKIISILLLVSTTILIFSACTPSQKVVKEKVKLVKVKEAKVQIKNESIKYFGFIEPSMVKALSLKNSGKINKINITTGQKITKDMPLVSLDTYEYGLGVKASKEQINLASLDLDKAEKSYDFYKKLYNDTLALYEKGAISKQKLDEIKLSYDINSSQYEQAKKNYSKSKIDLDYKSNSVNDSTLIADMDGVVVDILKKEGEIYAAGYPIVLIRTNENIVNIGVSEKDIKRLTLNMKASIDVDGKKYSGTISKINLMPDKLSRTYSVQIKLNDGNFIIGQSSEVSFLLNKIKGIWLPITDILNDGEDYVYIVKDNRVVRKNIELHEINESFVRVSNLNNGDKIIVTATNSLTEGYKVKIVGDTNE
ncbi:efflux RND transporter periplasmic adaptor subunit [Helicovermis profundi]|uniref:Efflux RND transporter periplasmic adaptor subunit n=1 Tax=Helicovermis profundi TaxID=3065157 RepID=A0AAU9EFX1_9FIRM|nr:efflux RND transporter periplasmic adaptor subunit [Clostridia bacterium S502]